MSNLVFHSIKNFKVRFKKILRKKAQSRVGIWEVVKLERKRKHLR